MGSIHIQGAEQIGSILINLLFPNCVHCGAPLSSDFLETSCQQCADLAFGFRTNRSLGIYTGKLKELIQLYKFQKRRLLKKMFVDVLVTHNHVYINEHEILVPMPLSRSRYAERGFNQCTLIAEGIARRTGIPFHGDILKRIGNSRPQSSLGSKSERLANMKDQFVLKSRYRKLVRDKRVLLFDDVMTTGATASRCAEALYIENARSVDLLTIGRALVGVEF